MCKFCDEKNPEPINGFRLDFTFPPEPDLNFECVVDYGYCCISEYIDCHYCPMCGRKLIKEVLGDER